MFHIQTLNNIAPCGVNVFPKDQYEVTNNHENPDGILVRSFYMHDLDLPTNLKAVARAGAGVNNIPTEAYAEKGIVVFNTPGANANAVKELVIASLLLSSRNLVDGVLWAKSLQGNGELVPQLVEAGKKEYVGTELRGKTVGIIGLGAIGALIANDLLALEMDVMGYDPYVSVETAWALSRNVQRATTLEQLYATCDYITVHVPLNEQTKEMFNRMTFSQMKKGMRILNFSRGELVDEKALQEAIEDGTVATYVTDFPNDNVLTMKNVIPIPHLGASTYESEENCALMAAKQLKSFLETGNIRHSVNYPNIELPYIGKRRITIAHKNIPNMVGQITSVLAANNINIANMINGSRGAFAYTIIDIDNHLNEEIHLDKIHAIEGIIAARVL
ncbi:3-phosphoglycerate dehydrogenase family protein [Priestia taiwanensis]|uniref:D-3-phosphoglycerate dehydrogenase n=1 Tax=Priestia taiwanensis TaxID=1347902 RepID=A0A917AMV4_9BACI|nr:3-phosphoglycerate dehydrogenase family protein [Priestia taiwanensis]MBM7362294.1 D-3-phosphoglycerate dehydrogenase [Priestia taiwanensis]GGE61030.1 D-3-phosphoglycerate dehydrogenase [Priestia taiwanensis]